MSIGPARYIQRGAPHATVVTWVGTYSAATPGAGVCADATVRLDNENELQQDAFLRLEPAQPMTCTINSGPTSAAECGSTLCCRSMNAG